jgi:branched-chain amino acid transport system permease protein
MSMDPPTGRPAGARIRTALAILAGAVALFSLSGATVGAQDTDAEVKGVLSDVGDDGEKVGVAGVVIVAFDAGGGEAGRAESADDGTWSIALPEGTFAIELDVSTLPEGVGLRNPDRNPVSVSLIPGDSKSALFPLGESTVEADSTIEVIQLAVDGLKLGLIIAMCAIGLSLIYGTTGLTNFAHGEAVTFGAMIGFLLNVTGIFGYQMPLILAAVVVIVVSGFSGWLFNRFVWAKMRRRGASLIAALVMSIGFSILFRYVMLFQFGGRAGFYNDFRLQSKWDLGVFSLAPKDLVLMILSVLVLVGVASALQFTRIGKAMRAVADNRDLAESSGIDVEQVISRVWIAGTALAGLGGVFLGVTESISWDMGFRILLLMFAGVTLGGLGTAYGALFGSIIVGMFIQLSTLIIPADMKNVGALLTLVVILLIRPQGLLGRKERIG